MAKQANSKPDSGAPPQGGAGNGAESSAATGNENAGQATAGKKKIRRPGKAGKKLFVGAKLIQFDAEGVAELDEAEASILLGLKNGYEEA